MWFFKNLFWKASLIEDIKKQSEWTVIAFKDIDKNLDYSIESLKLIDDFFDEQLENWQPKANGLLADWLWWKIFSISSYLGGDTQSSK